VLPAPVPATGKEAKPLETSALPKDLDPTAFVRVLVVKISSPNAPEGQPIDATRGSGVVIESEPGKAVVLTAAHLLRDFQPGKYVLQVVSDRGGSRPATIIMQDDHADVALLRVKIPNKIGTVSLARHSLPDKGEAVCSVGYRTGMDLKPVVVNAFVTHVNRDQGPENFEFGGLISQGFSGAAVLDSKSQLIGIATAVDKQNNQTVCRPAAEIRKLLATIVVPPVIPPDSAVELAQEHFASQPWVGRAKFMFRTQDAVMFFDEWTPSDDLRTVQFKPFAMIRHSTDSSTDENTFGIVCDSATFRFDKEFDLTKPNPFTPKKGTLEGLVRKSGDAGLKVIGEDMDYTALVP
jgi:hypothetical protein